MGDYNRTIWKDHIKDQNGNVIQQGTPVSAKNLNNMENQIVTLSAKENALAELVRESIPSGFTTLSDLDYTYMSTNPNSIKLLTDSVAYVNGYKIVIPAGTIINLDAPPSTGSREDLVFLEAWKQLDVNGAEQLSWRLRVVSGVDFTTFPEGFMYWGPAWNSCLPTAQGANSSPLPYSSGSIQIFTKVYSWGGINSQGRGDFNMSSDVGIVVAGQGDTASKTALRTTDGYVYAIPMFRVHRRNSGGYSANNGNGACTYKSISSIASFSNDLQSGQTAQTTVSSADYSNINVGEVYWIYSNTYALKVISKDGNNNITFMNVSPSGFAIRNTGYTWKIFSRPELTYADIVDIRDIIDLRHQVSLTGFNFQQLLEENFDRLLRGELQTVSKTSLLKTYHGINKTPIDSNTVFYASLDGTTIPEVGSYSGLSGTFKPMPTGLGINVSSLVGLNLNITPPCTIDFLMDWPNLFNLDSDRFIDYIKLNNNAKMLGVASGKGYPFIWDDISSSMFLSKQTNTVNILRSNSKNHVRLVFTLTGFTIYINGKIYGTLSGLNITSIDSIRFSVQTGLVISDLSISNIDRGSSFATLPQDFIDGYARISSAFNSQRSTFSDALTSETPLAQVKCSGSNSKEITVGDSSVFPKVDTTKWNSGDRIKVKGLGSEVISGVIDSDTALARITSVISGLGSVALVVTLSNVTGLVVNDIINVYTNTNTVYGSTFTVCAISGNQVTLSYGSNVSSTDVFTGGYIIDVDPTHSSPIVKANLTGTSQAGASSTITLPSTFSSTDGTYNGLTITITSGTGVGQVRTISGYIGSTKVATVNSAWTTNPDATSVFLVTGVPVTGTWSGLGTNESTFTLGSNNGLVAQDLFVYYSLNEVAGQGGMPEVITTTLGGVSNGKKLVVNPSVHIRDDFAGKVNGSTVVNPNVIKVPSGSTGALRTPYENIWTEANQSSLDSIKALDGNSAVVTYSTNGSMAQSLFSFNLIRIIEDKFGTLPCPPDTTSKIEWIKKNVSYVLIEGFGYGSCPSGNKINMALWSNTNNSYLIYSKTHTSNTPTKLAFGFDNSTPIYITDTGYVHLLAYTDASDGITPSTIYMDYIDIQLNLVTPIGYDVLAPENPRRDDAKGNILLVRKETKEIQTMFPRNNLDGIVTYGDYVPYQGLIATTGTIKAISNNLFFTTAGTGGAKRGNNQYSDCIYKLLGNNNLLYQCLNDDVSINVGAYDVNTMYLPLMVYWGGKRQSYIGRMINTLDGTYYDTSKVPTKSVCYRVYAGLKSINNMLYLVIKANPLSNGAVSAPDYNYDFILNNRPLIK